MTWTQPKTWTTEPLTSVDMNTHLRDNLNALKSPPMAHVTNPPYAQFATSSTTWVDVASNVFTLSITSGGGDLLVGFTGTVEGDARVQFNVTFNGVRQFPDADGVRASASVDYWVTVSFLHWITAPSAGTHTLNLQWKVNNAGLGRLEGGDEGYLAFWVREVS